MTDIVYNTRLLLEATKLRTSNDKILHHILRSLFDSTDYIAAQTFFTDFLSIVLKAYLNNLENTSATLFPDNQLSQESYETLYNNVKHIIKNTTYSSLDYTVVLQNYASASDYDAYVSMLINNVLTVFVGDIIILLETVAKESYSHIS